MRKHKDVEFHLNDLQGNARVYKSFEEASTASVLISLQMGSKYTNLDVVIWSENGARAWAGDDGVEQYREDPEASVFQRISIKADDRGRVP